MADRDGRAADKTISSRPSRYRVEEPRAYPKCSPAAGQAPATPPACTAVLVVHGMGQQIEFETLDALENGLRSVDPALSREAGPPAEKVRFVQLESTPLRRVEMNLTGAGAKRAGHEVHLYEAYWAPLTEGRVTLRDVIRFLCEATSNAFSQRKKPFGRWMFDQEIQFRPDRGSAWILALLTTAILFFVWMNTAAAVAVGWALWEGPQTDFQLFWDLTWVIQWPVASALLFGLALWLASVLRERNAPDRRLYVWNFVVYGALAVALLAVAAAAVLTTVAFLRHRVTGERIFPRVAYARLPFPLPFLGVVLSWGAFVYGVIEIREILVEYVGDVAAYISPSVLDRFADLRKRIKETVVTIARAIYESAAANGRGWQYDRVILVGHSLGSLIGYDALNQLINEDALEGDRQRVVSRTSLLLTLGSPLDKTAFLFARQGKKTSEAREALAGSVQPMIQSYARRPRRWVNFYSPHDPVSGALDYYDDEKEASARRKWIENRKDSEATVPLLSHIQYWRHPDVLGLLHASLTQEERV